MQENYRLLREAAWLLEAFDDPEYPPHFLHKQRRDLLPQLNSLLTAMEADQIWSSQDDDSIFLMQKVPDGWSPRILEPSRPLRFAATSPINLDHRVHVLARTQAALERFARVYDSVQRHFYRREDSGSSGSSNAA